MRHTYIIAEIGINHEGDVVRCKEMIEAATESGADAVKLQTIDVAESYARDSVSYSLFQENQLTQTETSDMFTFANALGVDVFTTVGDIATARWVKALHPTHWKISSGLINHIPLIREVSSFGQPILISTGMADHKDIQAAIAAARYANNNNEITLFHCTSIYPTPPHLVNLAAIPWLKKKYGLAVGFSDHSLGVEAASYAVASGAVAIEKHFTLDNRRLGLDHHIALEPTEFHDMVSRIRNTESLLGDQGRNVPEQLQKVRIEMLRCLVSRTRINKGTQLSLENIAVKRPGRNKPLGISPGELEVVVGCRALCDLEEDDPIDWSKIS